MFGPRNPLPLHAPSSHTARLPRTPGAFLQHPTNAHPSEYLAMCLAVKDQHADIREWLEHHQRLGVGKFYIYDNNSSRPMLPEFFDLVRLCEAGLHQASSTPLLHLMVCAGAAGCPCILLLQARQAACMPGQRLGSSHPAAPAWWLLRTSSPL